MKEILKILSILPYSIPFITGTFFIFSIFFNHQKSDHFKQEFFSTPFAKSISSLIRGFFKLVISLILNICLWFYILHSAEIKVLKFFDKIFANHELLIIFSVAFILVNIGIICSVQLLTHIPDFLGVQKNITTNKIYFFHSIQCIDTQKRFDKNISIYLIDFLNEQDILCAYYSTQTNQFVRIIIPYQSLIGLDIYTEKNLSLPKRYSQINNIFQNFSIKQKIQFFFIYFLPALFLLSLYKLLQMEDMIKAFLIPYIAVPVLFLSKSIVYYLKKLFVIFFKKGNHQKSKE